MIERVFYTRGTAPRRGLGAAVGSAEGPGVPSPGQAGSAAAGRGRPDTAPRGSAAVGVVGEPCRRSVGGRVRGVPRARGAGARPGPEGRRSSAPAARRELLTAEPPQETGSVRVCVRTRVRGFGLDLDIKQLFAAGEGGRAIFLPTFFFPPSWSTNSSVWANSPSPLILSHSP